MGLSLKQIVSLPAKVADAAAETAVDWCVVGYRTLVQQNIEQALQANGFKQPLIQTRSRVGSLLGSLTRFTSRKIEITREQIDFHTSLEDDPELEDFFDQATLDGLNAQLEELSQLDAKLRSISKRNSGAGLVFEPSSNELKVNLPPHQDLLRMLGRTDIPETPPPVGKFPEDLTVINFFDADSQRHCEDGEDTDKRYRLTIKAAFAERSDIAAKTAKSFLMETDFADEIKDLLLKTEAVLVIGSDRIEIFGAYKVDERFTRIQQLLDSYINPVLASLVADFNQSLARDKEVKLAAQIGVDTAKGNLKGAINVASYVGVPFAAFKAAELIAKEHDLAMTPELVAAVNSAALIMAAWIPSYAEVAEIAGGIDRERLLKMVHSRSVGIEEGDMSYYDALRGSLSPEETFQRAQVLGWIMASMLTATTASMGLLRDPWIFGLVMSLQVSANNWIGNLAMYMESSFGPLSEDVKRKHGLIEGDSGEAEEIDTERYAEIPRIVQERVDTALATMADKSDFKQNVQVMSNATRLTFRALFSKSKQEKKSPTEKKGLGYYKDMTATAFKALGLPFAGDHNNEKAFFARAFPKWNVIVPLVFWAMFSAVGNTDFAPAEAIDAPVNNIRDIVSATAMGVLLQGLLTAIGAADTAGAAAAAAVEVKYCARKKAIERITGEHAHIVGQAITGEGGEGARMEEITIDPEFNHVHDQFMEQFGKQMTDAGYKTHSHETVRDSDQSTIIHYRFTKGMIPGLKKEFLFVLIRKGDSDSFQVYMPGQVPNPPDRVANHSAAFALSTG
ncbi:hypothetical protein JKY72_05210 [Candidatus Gracilibacteria bacterium]|nr:hypothetical protein [Candidatus Gracilibacteria bacterium]